MIKLTQMVCLLLNHSPSLSSPVSLSSGRPELEMRHLSATQACDLYGFWSVNMTVDLMFEFLLHTCMLSRWKFLLELCKHEVCLQVFIMCA